MSKSSMPSVNPISLQSIAISTVHNLDSDNAESTIRQEIHGINILVAQFRDRLIRIGQPGDCSDHRESIRKIRRNCIEACRNTAQQILPIVRRTTDIGIPIEYPNLALLYYIMKMLLRELCRSKSLVHTVPMDMTSHYENRAGPSNIGNVVSQIILQQQITPDFYQEELCSIRNDSAEIRSLIDELQEFMPQSDGDIEKYSSLQSFGRSNHAIAKINRSRQEKSVKPASESSYCGGLLSFFCCTAKNDEA